MKERSEGAQQYFDAVVNRMAFLLDLTFDSAKVHAEWERDLIDVMMRNGSGHLATTDAVIDAQVAKGRDYIETNIREAT